MDEWRDRISNEENSPTGLLKAGCYSKDEEVLLLLGLGESSSPNGSTPLSFRRPKES